MGKRIFKLIKGYFYYFLELLYPFDDKCLCCGEQAESYLCPRCFKGISFVDKGCFTSLEDINIRCYSCTYYSHTMKQLILNFKYKRDFLCSDYFTILMKDYIINNNIEFDIITYVPSDKKALKKRGFNQSKVLATKIAEVLDKKCLDLLVRKSGSLEQKRLSKEDRWNNLKESFSAKPTVEIKDKKILIIDDVFTTGATAYYCAKALISIGVSEIIVLTLAKSNV